MSARDDAPDARLPSGANGGRGLLSRVRIALEMIKFEHSVFALPFALTGAVLALRRWPSWSQVAWIIVAMIAARTAAMTFNRIADAKLDALNPRTHGRALPSGKLSMSFAAAVTVIASAIFVLAAYELNRLAFELSPVALAILLSYSYTKRFTWLSHLALGVCLGISPIAAWIALGGDLKPVILLLGGAVALWVCGFDLIYACQDVEFDRQEGLSSFPCRYGIRAALRGSAWLHVLMIGLLSAVAWMARLGWLAALGLVVVAALLAYEHYLVRPSDLSRVNAAFFNINGYISVLFFLTWAGDILLRRGRF
ncbi:MAG: UbiA-like polyprenyltransferase [Terriglobia bacterium]